MTTTYASQAIAYLRTSSAANVDGDSSIRQQAAIAAYAKAAGLEIVETFYDAAVSGADPVTDRPGFAAMLERIAGNGVRKIVVETASRFARDLMVQEVGHATLRGLGVELIAADSPTAFLDDTPTAQMVRQILGAVAQFEKAMVVAKLKGARDRASKAAGRRVEGAKATLTGEALAAAKRLHRKNPATGKRRSLRKIAAEMAAEGHVNPRTGQAYSPTALMNVLGQ
jgi:DNA invertase Pin-like site-specific DNA recombinase